MTHPVPEVLPCLDLGLWLWCWNPPSRDCTARTMQAGAGHELGTGPSQLAQRAEGQVGQKNY